MPKAFDYINRPPEFLEHDPLYLFENYERVTLKSLERNRTQPSESPAAAAAGSEGQLHLSGFDLEAPATEPDAHTRRPWYYFASEHPLHETHALQKTKHERVATIKFRRLPDRRKFDTAAPDATVLQDRLDYAQAALICCTAWTTLEDLIGPHPEDLSQIPEETWWLAFKHKLQTTQITPRGSIMLACAQEWYDSPIEDQDDMLGGHGPLHERFEFDREDFATEPASVDWEMFALLCEEHQATSSRDTKALQALEQSIMPMKVVPKELKLPGQQQLDQFVESNFLSETDKKKRPFALVCPCSSVTVENAQPLPPSDSVTVDISTLVTDMPLQRARYQWQALHNLVWNEKSFSCLPVPTWTRWLAPSP